MPNPQTRLKKPRPNLLSKKLSRLVLRRKSLKMKLRLRPSRLTSLRRRKKRKVKPLLKRALKILKKERMMMEAAKKEDQKLLRQHNILTEDWLGTTMPMSHLTWKNIKPRLLNQAIMSMIF